MYCDDHGDCPAKEQCFIIEGSIGTYGQCFKPSACHNTCSCGAGSFTMVCDTLSDCPACATGCKPYKQFGQGPEFPVKVCTW